MPKYITIQVEETEFYGMKEVLQKAESAIKLSDYFMTIIQVLHAAIKTGAHLHIAADDTIRVNDKTIDTVIKEGKYGNQ